MHTGKRFPPWLLLLLVIALAPMATSFAQTPAAAQKSATASMSETTQPANPSAKPAGQESRVERAEEVLVPIKSEKIDEEGQKLGKKIDAVSAGASLKVGRWINARAFGEISWLKLIICMGLVLLVMAIERAIRRLLSLRMTTGAQGADPRWSDLLLESLSGPLSLFIRIYGIYWALSPIWSYFDSPGALNLIHRAVGKAADLGGTVALFWFLYRFVHLIDFRIRGWVASTDNSINEMLVPLVSKTVRVFVIVVGGMMVVQNMTGIEIGPLVASLGIGGLAFALAGKDSIANFLGSLTILLDKPFQVGERIVIEKHDGFVEGVGFRSTRIRTLTGNLVSIPNEKIINSTLENIANRTYLRWRTNLGITCETPPERVERAVAIVREVLDGHEGTREDYPPRVCFNGFNDWSLNIAIHAWYFPPDFWKYQEWIQGSCLEIMRRFQDEGIEMAYPTQAVRQIGVSGISDSHPSELNSDATKSPLPPFTKGG